MKNLHWNKRLTQTWMIILLLASITIAGCSANQAANSSSAQSQTNSVNDQAASSAKSIDKTIKVALSSDAVIDRLDAGAYTGSMHVQAMIYDGLVTYGEKGELQPALAEAWDISDDGKVYTFHLRQGVKFSDGTDLNADAVKFSFERWIYDQTHSLNIATALDSLEAVDEYTFTMTFNKAYYPFLTELSFARPVRIISPSAVEPAGDVNGTFSRAIGTGAWMVESYNRDQEAVLVRNPYYWGDAPKLNKIVFKVIPDPQSRVLALQSGDVDIAGTQLGKLPVESVPVLENEASLSLHDAAGTNSHFMIFNYNKPIFKDLQVRQAINLALDKISIVEDLMNGIGNEAKGLFPLTVPYVTDSNNNWYGYDPTEAKQLLAEAGYSDADGDGIVEKDGVPLELNLVLQQVEYPEWKSIGEMIQYELMEIGIAVKLQILEPNAYYDALWTSRAYDMIMYRTYDDAYNPHSFLLSLFHKSEGAPAVVWSDAGLESLIQTAVGTTDLKKRQETYDLIFDKLYREAMFAAVYFPDEIVAVNKRVTGFQLGHSTFAPILWNQLDVGEE